MLNQYSSTNTLLYRWLGVLRCPQCQHELTILGHAEAEALQCQSCAAPYPLVKGVPRLLKPQRVAPLAKFCAQYDALRLQEGWASENPEFYQHLPFHDLTGRHAKEWRLRARSWQVVQNWVERFARGRRLRVVEAGAGSGWLSQQLAQAHDVLAMDANAGRHGLGALPHAQRRFLAVQAELDCLPLAEHAFDLIIANASLHYVAAPESFFAQAHRALRPTGRLIVMDSPVYSNPRALAEAHARSQAYYRQMGFPELAQNYGGLLAAHFSDGAAFAFTRLRHDFKKMDFLKKIVREKWGGSGAARFPIFAGRCAAAPAWQPGRARAGALLVQDQKLLTYHFHGAQQYWRIPGGGVEEDETPAQAARRELHEEIGLEITLQEQWGPYFLSNKAHWYFMATADSRKLPAADTPGLEEDCTVHWLPLSRLAEYDLRPAGLKWELVEHFRKGTS